MTGEDPSIARQLVDPEALRPVLEAHLGPDDGSYDVERHQAGHSNETFFVTWDGETYVLRRPPLGELLPTAHDVIREHHVLSHLQDTSARVPRTVLAVEDETVLGKPFYLMERVHGHVVREELPEALDDPGNRERIGHELVDTLAELHLVDLEAAGLGDWAKGTGYLERQVTRWTGQLHLTQPQTEDVRDVPELREIAGWLAEHVPATPRITLVHGDYKLDNVVLAPEAPARIEAVLDWEMSTLGDPLADLGYLLTFWADAGDDLGDLTRIFPTFTMEDGFPSRSDLVARYADRTGFPVQDLHFHRVLAVFKLATLLEGGFMRSLQGTTDDPFLAEMEWAVPELATRGVDLAEGRIP